MASFESAVVLLLISSISLANEYKIKVNSEMPGPFTRELSLQNPLQTGKDVIILQNLLKRHQTTKDINISSHYDIATAEAVQRFQEAVGLPGSGVVCPKTAHKVLDKLLSDGFKDDGLVPAPYKFKLVVPVYRDRTKETTAVLLDAKSQPVYKFRIRAHGGMQDDGTAINQLTRNGNTPTGLSTFDLNSKEPIPKSYGPYPVVRIVKGIKGNSAIGYGNDTLLSNYRSGILLHTGEWDGWDPSKPMPNSLGCMHCAPEDMKNVVDILVKELGVKVRPNPFGKLPYPYVPQGLIAIEEIN
ncbi:uncharacterized protein LOC135695733 [Rhopilema esculentum]|uniref:uncharacterized protein LOC135695733 n=1 Tax=Rhopilema esculentum TaxID=499914 RepID=UPI0031D130D6|eukprot:gene11652-21898_t